MSTTPRKISEYTMCSNEVLYAYEFVDFFVQRHAICHLNWMCIDPRLFTMIVILWFLHKVLILIYMWQGFHYISCTTTIFPSRCRISYRLSLIQRGTRFSIDSLCLQSNCTPEGIWHASITLNSRTWICTRRSRSFYGHRNVQSMIESISRWFG